MSGRWGLWAMSDAEGHDLEFLGFGIEFGFNLMVLTLFSFIILAVLFAIFLWPRLSQLLVQRQENQLKAIEEAEAALREAQQVRQQAQGRLQEAPAEVQRRLEEARRDAETLKRSIAEAGTRDLELIRQRAINEIQVAEDRASTTIWNRAVDRAVTLARSSLTGLLGEGEHAKLIAASLDRLPSGSPSSQTPPAA